MSVILMVKLISHKTCISAMYSNLLLFITTTVKMSRSNEFATTATTQRDDDPDRLNFEDIDALNNDFEEDSDEEDEAIVATRVHMTTEERMDKLFDDIGGLGRF